MSLKNEPWFERAVQARVQQLEEQIAREALKRISGEASIRAKRQKALVEAQAKEQVSVPSPSVRGINNTESRVKGVTYYVALGKGIELNKYPTGTFRRQVAALARVFLEDSQPRRRDEMSRHITKYVPADQAKSVGPCISALIDDGFLRRVTAHNPAALG